MSSILSFSFFITKHMKTDLHAGQLSGTLPILYVFLARSGKTIRDVSLVALDDKGAVHFANENAGRNADARRPDHVCRQRRRGKDAVLFLAPIFPIAASRASGFLKFCATLAPGNSLIKSASYLLHAGNFTTVRDFLLANSATIIQDNSGIPLGDYDPKKWRFFPFGRYAGPIAEFPGRYQPKYAELFRAQPADGFRHRLSLAIVRIEPAAVGQACRRRSGRVEHRVHSGRDVPPRSPRPKQPRPPTQVRAARRFCSSLALEFTSERFGSAR